MRSLITSARTLFSKKNFIHRSWTLRHGHIFSRAITQPIHNAHQAHWYAVEQGTAGVSIVKPGLKNRLKKESLKVTDKIINVRYTYPTIQ